MKIEELAVLVSSSFTKVYQEFDKLNGRIGGLENEMREGFRYVDQRFERLEKKVDRLGIIMDGNEARISTLEEECVEA